jgi:hypothetical protein
MLPKQNTTSRAGDVAGRLFGRSRDEGSAAASPPPIPGLAVPLHPISVRLFTADGADDVQLEAGSHRITDLLNAPEPLRLRAAPERDGDPEAEWVEVSQEDRDEILIIVPPPRDTNPLQRLHRPGQQVVVVIGPYVIAGEAHVPPGSDATGFLQRHRPHFVALTRAQIREGDGQDLSVPVAIVNLQMADGVRDADAEAAGVRAARIESEYPSASRPDGDAESDADSDPTTE